MSSASHRVQFSTKIISRFGIKHSTFLKEVCMYWQNEKIVGHLFFLISLWLWHKRFAVLIEFQKKYHIHKSFLKYGTITLFLYSGFFSQFSSFQHLIYYVLLSENRHTMFIISNNIYYCRIYCTGNSIRCVHYVHGFAVSCTPLLQSCNLCAWNIAKRNR